MTAQASTYAGAHYRVRKARGSASDFACAACRGTAQGWALAHETPVEFLRRSYKGAYSVRPDDYIPLCTACHNVYDGPFATLTTAYLGRHNSLKKQPPDQRVWPRNQAVSQKVALSSRAAP